MTKADRRTRLRYRAVQRTSTVRVQIAADVSLLRRTLWQILQETPGVKVVGESATYDDTLTVFSELRPQLLIADSSLKANGPLPLVDAVRKIDHTVKTVLLVGCSRFDVELERRRSRADSVAVKPVDPVQLVHAVFEAMESETKRFDQADTGKQRILIVDDDPVIRKLMRRVLEKAGYAICAEAISGDEALYAVGDKQPDLVLLDVNIERLSGLWVIEQLRRIDQRVPVIMVTSARDRETVSEAAKHGISGYVIKPFEPNRLLEQVAAALAKPVAVS